MSKWAGKYVIGLTGNIGTGKSVVRRMLEHLGAYGIDADALAHRAIAKGSPGYQPIVDLYGRWILAADGQVDRARLGRIVFSDPEALAALEQIIHPLVGQAVDAIVKRAPQPVIVIEAIKLLESDLKGACDSIWVTYTRPEIQVERLVKNRNMTEVDARQRINAQPPQEQKTAAANIVIKNDGSFEETWQQVSTAWQNIVAPPEGGPETLRLKRLQILDMQELTILRGKPRHSSEIAALFNRLRKPAPAIQAADIMAAFGEKAFLILQNGKTLSVLIGWQVENLISRTTDILIDPSIPAEKALPVLLEEMERESKSLQCELSLIAVPQDLNLSTEFWSNCGYKPCTPGSLEVQAWQEAANESLIPGTVLYFKLLRHDRVLRPF